MQAIHSPKLPASTASKTTRRPPPQKKDKKLSNKQKVTELFCKKNLYTE